MIDEAAMNVAASRMLCWRAGWKKGRGLRNTKESSVAKAFWADMALKVTADAVQVFDGYGYSSESPVKKPMRDATIYPFHERTSQIQRLIIGREIVVRNP